MTAASLFVTPGAAFVLADQASFHDDGTVLAIGSKVSISNRLHLAMTSAGAGYHGMRTELHTWLDGFDRQDDVLAGLPDLTSRLLASMIAGTTTAEREANPIPAFLQFYVALWSDARDQPEAYIVGTAGGTFGSGYPVGRLAGVSQLVSPPVDLGGDEFTPAKAGQIVDAQRRTPDDRGIFRVGGGAELVEVRADGVTRRVVRKWPDRIGCKINP